MGLIIFLFFSFFPGFISIDCGAPNNTNYTDPTTGINYVSDAGFIDTGISRSISSEFNASDSERQLQNLRSFPEGDRNCYKVGLKRGTKYLIRATFVHGNYDGKNEVPEFDVYMGPNKWVTVQTKNVTTIWYREIIHVPTVNYIDVCLVNTGFGTPFISVLELRPLMNVPYNTTSGPLALFLRSDHGSADNETVR